MTKLITLKYILGDAAEHFQIKFQDPASMSMEGLMTFNNHLLLVIVAIIGLVGWLLANTIFLFQEEKSIGDKPLLVHATDIEIIWTTVPALILLSLASPSFSLLYSMDELTTPELTVKIMGHQWFWSYEISDFQACSKNSLNLKYVCYLLVDEDLKAKKEKGYFRLLETNKRIVLPTNTHIRLLVSSVDVLHSWTIPSFGVKIDACPGRLNSVSLFLKRIGIFYGQCSEICGVNHGFMPIVVMVVPSIKFNLYVLTKTTI